MTGEAIAAIFEVVTCDTRTTGAEATARADDEARGVTAGTAGSEAALEGTTAAAATKVSDGGGSMGERSAAVPRAGGDGAGRVGGRGGKEGATKAAVGVLSLIDEPLNSKISCRSTRLARSAHRRVDWRSGRWKGRPGYRLE